MRGPAAVAAIIICLAAAMAALIKIGSVPTFG